MTFEEAIRKSMISYYKGKSPEELIKSSEGRTKYTKKYFDKIEEEKFGNSTGWKSIKNAN